jgi:putative FmdB family regulatory protein
MVCGRIFIKKKLAVLNDQEFFMPIFEFVCQKCKNQFEELFLSSTGHIKAECPKCQSKKVNKLISAGSFRPKGIPKGSGGFKPPSCSPSGG